MTDLATARPAASSIQRPKSFRHPGTLPVTIRYADAAAVLDPPTELPDGNKRISASGIPGHDYLIQATTSTTDPASWVTIGTNAADSCGKSVFCDLNATNYNFRYYRIAAP